MQRSQEIPLGEILEIYRIGPHGLHNYNNGPCLNNTTTTGSEVIKIQYTKIPQPNQSKGPSPPLLIPRPAPFPGQPLTLTRLKHPFLIKTLKYHITRPQFTLTQKR